MGDHNAHARKVLLRRWTAYRLVLTLTHSRDEISTFGNRMMECANILMQCRHVGDDPQIKGEEWVVETQRCIARALERITA